MEFPIIYEPRCQTCRHPRRVWIERQMMEGMPFVVIAYVLHGVEGRDIRTRSLSRHYKKHLLPLLTRIVIRAELDQMMRAMRPRASSDHDGPRPREPLLATPDLARE